MTDVHFEAPGAGMWELDRSHYPGGTTPISQWLMQGCPNGMRGAFEEFARRSSWMRGQHVGRYARGESRPTDSQLIELSPREAMALIQIANAGGVRAGSVSEDDLNRLYSLGLVEQRGLSMGLTAIGMQTIARRQPSWPQKL